MMFKKNIYVKKFSFEKNPSKNFFVHKKVHRKKY